MISADDLELLQAYLDGTLSETDELAMQDRLRDEPGLAEAVVRLSRDEAVIQEWASANREAESTSHNREGAPAGDRFPPRIRRMLRTASGIAALVALGLLTWMALPGPEETREPLAVAHLEEVQGKVFVVPEFGDPIPAKSGQPLALGQKVRTQGDDSFAVLTFPDRSRLEVSADTTIQLNSSSIGPENSGRDVYVYLEQGQVAADAAQPSHEQPMIVQTLHAEAVLLGTRSSVASQADETRVDSEKGRVLVKRKSDGRSIDVRSGEYAVAGPNRQFASKPAPARLAEILAIPDETGVALSASFSADGSMLTTGCSDGTIKVWDVGTGAQRQVIRAHSKAIRLVAFSPVGPLLVSVNEERVLKFWNPLTGYEAAAVKMGKVRVECLAFSPDGALLVTAGSTSRDRPDIYFWDVAERKELGSMVGHKGGTTSLAFSPDGRTLATAGRDGAIKLWDLTTRQLRQTLVGHIGRINTVAYSPDGTYLVSGGQDRTVRRWDPVCGMEIDSLKGNRAEVRCLAFSPDGNTLTSADGNLTLWDMPSGKERLTFRAHKRQMATLSFSPDGKLLATTGWDKIIRLWDATKVVR